MGNKNSIIALGIIGVLFLVFALYSTKEQEKYQAELAAYNARQSEMELKTQSAQAATTSFESESKKLSEAKAAADVETFGSALIAARGEKSSVVTMANDLMSVTIDPRGAQIVGVELKEYTKYAPKGERTELIEMMERASAKMDLSFYIRNGLNNVKINTADYTFKSLPEQSVAGAKRRSFILEVGSGASIEYIYTLYSDESDARSYMMDFDIKLHSLSPMMASENVMLAWQNTSFQNEKGFTNENTYTTISYHIAGEGGADDLGVSTDNKSEQIVGEIEWIAFKQQFFSSIIIAKDNIKKADVSYTTAKPHSGYMKRFSAEMELPYSASRESYSFALYFGPNKYSTLKSVNDLGYGDIKLEELVPLGWGIIGWVNKWLVIPIFDLLLGTIGSFGIIILILAILVKLIISPMTYSSYVSMAKMRLIKPEVDEINKKYAKQDEAMKRQQATMDLYKKAGINPLGGCIPMLIQMPIVIAMFRFFPASIELREKPFLWADDLSSYDSIINLPFEIPFYGDHVSLFALLMAVVMFFYSKMNYDQSASSQPQMAGMKFMMVYMMPVMMLMWFNSYASGLCYYYFLANLLTIAQTLIIRKMTHDDKIQAIMDANAIKRSGKKKSKFQQRYEEILAEQQRAQQQKKR